MRIYLAGGFYSNWQDKVRQSAINHEYYNPELDSKQTAICDFVSSDLKAIDWCDLLFVYKQRTNPTACGLSAEMGYAYAKGKPIVLVDDNDRIDSFLAGLSQRIYTNLDSAIEYLRGL